MCDRINTRWCLTSISCLSDMFVATCVLNRTNWQVGFNHSPCASCNGHWFCKRLQVKWRLCPRPMHLRHACLITQLGFERTTPEPNTFKKWDICKKSCVAILKITPSSRTNKNSASIRLNSKSLQAPGKYYFWVLQHINIYPRGFHYVVYYTNIKCWYRI